MSSISSRLWQAEIKRHNPADFGSRRPAGVASNPSGSEVHDLLEDLLGLGNGGCPYSFQQLLLRCLNFSSSVRALFNLSSVHNEFISYLAHLLISGFHL